MSDQPVQPTRSGPNVRAGFTDAPVSGISATWIVNSVSGIASRALGPYLSLRVTWRITTTKIAEKISSRKNALASELERVAVFATSSREAQSTRIRSDAQIAPRNCAIQYQIVSSALRRRSRNIASDTIGLKWPPETSPNAYRPASSARPNPKATPRSPALLLRIATDPPNTRMSVPRNSATYFCQLFM